MINKRQMTKLVSVGVLMVIAIVWTNSFTGAAEETYRIEPEIGLDSYKSDTVRVMDAYERLMDRYMMMVQANLTDISQDGRGVANKLDSIDRKLDSIAARLTRIERALNIEPAEKAPTRRTTARPAAPIN